MDKLDKIVDRIVDSLKKGRDVDLDGVEKVFLDNSFEHLIPVFRNRIRRHIGRSDMREEVLVELAPANNSQDGEKVLAHFSKSGDIPKREVIRPNLIGGVRVSATGERFDATIDHQILRLEALLKE